MNHETPKRVQNVQPRQPSMLEISGDHRGPRRAVQDVPLGSLPQIRHLRVRLDRTVRPDHRGVGVRAPAGPHRAGKQVCQNDPHRLQAHTSRDLRSNGHRP